MDRGTGDRAVSEVVGFILIFGMLVTAFTIYQGIVVPDQNRQVEFQHNQEVQGQMQDLRNAILSTAATDSGQAVSVTLGASYPTRALAMNLGVSAGSLQTTGSQSPGVIIQNVSTTDGQTADYVSGSLGPFPTTSIRYVPVYSFYTEAPDTLYENSIVYNQFDDANITVTDQVLFDGRDVTLVTLNGSLSAAQENTISVNTRPVSVSATRVPISSNGSGPITVTVPSRLSASRWEELLGDEYDPAGPPDTDGYVSAVKDAGPHTVQFVLETGHDYGLRMARIGVGAETTETTPHYLTVVSGNGTSVQADGRQQLVVEVRDTYNNPKSGATVNVSEGKRFFGEDSVETGADGRATFTFEAPPSPGSETVTMNMSAAPAPREEVTFSLTVEASGGGGGGGGTAGAYDLFWTDPLPSCDSTGCTWDVGADSDDLLTISAATDPALDGMGLNFAVDNTTVATIESADQTTDTNGEGTVDIRASANGTVGIYVATGGASDRINVTLEGVRKGLFYNDDATAESGTGVENSVVEFSVTNDRSESVTITDVTILSSSAGTQVREFGPEQEVEIDADDDGGADSPGGFDVGETIDLSGPGGGEATLFADSTATIRFYEFQDDNNDPVDMTGQTVTIQLRLDDGSTDTIVLEL